MTYRAAVLRPRISLWERLATTATVAFAAATVQIKTQQHPSNVIQGVVQPSSFLLIAVLARRTGAIDVSTAALGAALVAIWTATIWSAGSILRAERWQGTLSQIMSRPTGLGTVLVGKTAGATLRSTLFIAVTISVTALALGDPIRIARPVPFLAALAAVLVSAVTLGLLLSSLFVLTRAAGRISEVLMYPVFILGGLLVPVALLPGWLQPLSTVVSLRWGGELLKASALGSGQSAKAWLALALTTAVYGVLARASFSRVLTRARQEGTLDLY
jgi:ABC-2 type transport system permease protein